MTLIGQLRYLQILSRRVVLAEAPIVKLTCIMMRGHVHPLLLINAARSAQRSDTAACSLLCELVCCFQAWYECCCLSHAALLASCETSWLAWMRILDWSMHETADCKSTQCQLVKRCIQRLHCKACTGSSRIARPWHAIFQLATRSHRHSYACAHAHTAFPAQWDSAAVNNYGSSKTCQEAITHSTSGPTLLSGLSTYCSNTLITNN